MSQRTVIWIGEGADVPRRRRLRIPGSSAQRASGLAEQMQALGVRIVHARQEEAIRIAADACIVHLSQTPDPPFVADVRRQGPTSTLWIVDSEPLERAALELAGAEDDVARTPADAATLILRLERMLTNSDRKDRDALTGALNRRAFGRLLRRALDELMPGEHRALVMLDLDGFKQINDQYGHAIGDQLLQVLARSLEDGLGPDEHVGRMGGDEFVVLLTRYDPPSLVREAERLVRSISTPIELPGIGEIAVGASAGLAMLRPGLTEPQILRQADSATYEAKSQGRGRLVHFELIHDGADAGPEADLRRFSEVTRMFGERMNRMVAHMGRQLVDAARVQALQDPLTGAHNRGFFKERLPREIDRARSGQRPLTMALLDIDNFHDVNMTYGWPSGDAVLQRFVEVASASIRVVDWLARYGGEEFAVVLPDTDLNAACTILERLRAAVETTGFLALDGRRIPVTISVGVATLTETTSDALSLANQASSACLAAKAGGKNQVAVAR